MTNCSQLGPVPVPDGPQLTVPTDTACPSLASAMLTLSTKKRNGSLYARYSLYSSARPSKQESRDKRSDVRHRRLLHLPLDVCFAFVVAFFFFFFFFLRGKKRKPKVGALLPEANTYLIPNITGSSAVNVKMTSMTSRLSAISGMPGSSKLVVVPVSSLGPAASVAVPEDRTMPVLRPMSWASWKSPMASGLPLICASG